MADSAPESRVEWIGRMLREHEEPLLRYATRLLGDRDAASDVVQETFLRLCAERNGSADNHVVPWLYRVCRQRAFDVLRKEKRQMTTHDGAQIAESADSSPPADAQLEQYESENEVLRLLATLPKNQQEVVRLKFQGGLRYREIAEVTGLSVSNVGFLIHSAIKRLREKLADTGASL